MGDLTNVWRVPVAGFELVLHVTGQRSESPMSEFPRRNSFKGFDILV